MTCSRDKLRFASYRLLAFVALGLSAPYDSFAQVENNRAVRYTVRVWQTDDGLPQNSVRAVAQTPDGFLWVGTDEGLVRFDGIRFVALESPEFPELRLARVASLLVARDGALWIGTETDGAARFGDGRLTRFTRTNGLPNDYVRCIVQSRSGAVWVGTEKGLAVFENGVLRDMSAVSGASGSIRSIVFDREGDLRLGTYAGLTALRSDGKPFKPNSFAAEFTRAFRSMLLDSRNELWLGSIEGLFRGGEDARQWTQQSGMPSPVIAALFEDSAGQVWVGTFGGLVRFINGRPAPWSTDARGLDDPVNAIFEDREANIWIGAKNGLHRLSPARFQVFSADTGLAGNNITAVCEGSDGAIWASSWGAGLNRITTNGITTIRQTNGLTSESTLALDETRDGRLWVGLDHGGGLNRLSATFSNDYPRLGNPIPTAARVIHQDRQNALWVGTSRGLVQFQDDRVTTFTATNGLAGDVVMALCESRNGALWIGTDGGLNRWQQGHFDVLRQKDGLSHSSINAIYEDGDGVLWIGTKAGGLNRLRYGEFNAYTTAQGLFSDEIFEVVEDDAGYFWMTCRRGLFRVKKSEFAALDRGEIRRLNCVTFTRDDGLPTPQFNGVAKPAGLKARDGRLWFPTIRGVVAVETRIKSNDKPPLVAIEEIIANHTVLRPAILTSSPPARIHVPPAMRELEIHYTALSLQVAEKNQFRHRLDGVDSDWVEAGTRRVANYHALRPGTVQFRVQARNNDGVWSERDAVIEIVVLPRFWETPAFKILVALAVGGLLVAFYRARVARLREIENLRMRIASDLHDDVGSRLTRVAMVTELAEHEVSEGDPGKGYIRNIAGTVREITRAMDEIVWTINPRNDALDNFASYAFQYAEEYFRGTGVKCRLDFPVELPDQFISTEGRHNFFMAFKESLSNVLKHARASEVRISLAISGSQVTLVVADNGIGMDTRNSNSTGDGLKNMRTRLQQIGGRMLLESEPGRGTSVTLQAPIR